MKSLFLESVGLSLIVKGVRPSFNFNRREAFRFNRQEAFQFNLGRRPFNFDGIKLLSGKMVHLELNSVNRAHKHFNYKTSNLLLVL